MDKVIDVVDLSKRYGSRAVVDRISFDVSAGEIFGIIGPNGAGKTTTVECVQGLRRPDVGYVRVLGLNPQTESRALRWQIGSQLQESALPRRIKVWEALDLFASFTPGALDWHVLMEQWGLREKSRASFTSLSGGQRQRLLVALALVNDPKVVFLDEMTTGLDPAARRVAWELIKAIQERGTTVVLVTHFMDEAERLCDRVAVVDHGHIVAIDTPQGLINTHGGNSRIIFSTDYDDISWLADIHAVAKVRRRGSRVEITGSGPVVMLTANALVEHGITPADFRVEQPTLEEVFLNLTSGSMG